MHPFDNKAVLDQVMALHRTAKPLPETIVTQSADVSNTWSDELGPNALQHMYLLNLVRDYHYLHLMKISIYIYNELDNSTELETSYKMKTWIGLDWICLTMTHVLADILAVPHK